MMTTRTYRIVVLEVFLSPMDFDALLHGLKVIKISKKKVKECEYWRNEGKRNKITKHKLEKIREIGQKEQNFYNIPDSNNPYFSKHPTSPQ